MAMGEQLKVLDKLASPNSLISDANRLLSVQWRDRLLQDLKAQLFSWFDVSTGRLFQLNTTYNSVIGLPRWLWQRVQPQRSPFPLWLLPECLCHCR
jgi:hypothetical protein